MALDSALGKQESETHHPSELCVPAGDRRIAPDIAAASHSTPVLRRDALFRRALATGDLVALAATTLLLSLIHISEPTRPY